MSKQIDERVVSMEFDNSRFEKNVSTTMSTLDKLKHALKFDGASKGLEDINSAAGKVNMSGLGGAVDTVKAKFSALDVVAVTALANITNKAVDAGEKLVKSLSIDQVTSGWDKYAQKTASVQTLVNSTGKSLDEINGYLDKLMWYSDETSYGFTDMTSALATMTSSGGDIEKLIPMIEGVANATAYAGKGAAEFSRVMQYGVNQAYSLGYMQAQDWRTIEGATVNSKQLIEALIAAGEELETIKKGEVTLENFRSSLADKWLTSDVMEAGFGQFSKVTEEIYEGIESGIFENYADGLEQIGDKYGEVALRAAASSQEAKTFTEAIDATKDAVSSGWMNTFELIFGDYEKAKVLWTDLAETLYDVFAAGGEIRNWILEIALNFTKPWNEIMEKLEGSGLGKVKDLANNFENIGDSIKNAADRLEYFQDIVSKVWRGEYNRNGDNPDRRDLLTAAGYDYRVVQDLVNLGADYELTIEDIEASHKKYGITLENNAEATKEILKPTKQLSDEQLKNAGLTEEEIRLYRALEKEAKRLGISVSDLADEMSKNDGQTLLIDSFKNLGSILLDIGNIAKEAWKAIFNPPGAEEIAVRLYGIIKSLNEFTEKIRLTNKETGKLTEAGEKIQRIFKGIFAVVDVLSDIVGGALSAAFEILREIFGSTNISILDVAASVGDALVVFRNWITESEVITGVFGAVVEAAKRIINIVKRWIKAFKDIPFVSDLLEDIKQLFSDINSDANEGTDNVKKWVGSFDGLSVVSQILNKIGKAFDWIGGIVEKAITAIGAWFKVFKETEGVQQLVSAVSDLVDAFSKLFSGEISVNEFARVLGDSLGNVLASLPKMAIQIGKDFIAGFQNGLSDSISGIIGKIVEFCLSFVKSFAEALGVQSPSWKAYQIVSDFFQGAINAIGDMLAPVLAALEPVGEAIVKIFKSFWGYITDDNGEIEWGKIFAGAITIESLLILKSFADAMDKFASAATSFSGVISGVKNVLTSVSTSITRLGKAVATDLRSDALLKMAIAIGVLAASIWVLCQIDDYGKLGAAVLTIVVLAGILIGLTAAMNKLNSASVAINKSGVNIDGLKTGLLQIGIALVLLAAVVKIISGIPVEQAKQGFIGLAGIAAGMIIFMAAMGAISLYSKDVSGFGRTMIKISAAMLIMIVVIKMIARMDPADIVVGIAVMQAFALLCVEMGIANRVAGAVGNGASFIKIAVAMGLMALVIKLIATMDPSDIVAGIEVMQAFVILLAEMAVVNRLAGSSVSKFGGTIVAMSFSMILLAGVLLVLSKMDESVVDKGIATMQKFVLLIAELIVVSKLAGKESAKIAGNLLAMAVSIGILAGIVVLLGMCEDADMTKGLAVVAGLGAIMSAMIWATRGASNCKQNLIAMVSAIAVMAVVVVALSFLDTNDLAACTAAMVLLMGSFALMIKSMSGLEKGKISTGTLVALAGILVLIAGLITTMSHIMKDSTSAIAAAGAISMVILALAAAFKLINGVELKMTFTQLQSMALVILEVAAILSALSFLPNPMNMIPSAIAIGILLNTLATSMLIMSKAKGDYKTTFTQLQSMVLVIAEIAVILGIMSYLDVQASIPNAIAIGVLLNLMATAMVIASYAGQNASKAMGAMLIMGLVVGEIGLVFAMITALNAQATLNMALALGTVLIAMSVACLIASYIPAAAAIEGAKGLAAFIAIMGAVIAAFGALTLIPGFTTIMQNGAEIFTIIGEAIGGFVGGIISGVGSGVASSLTQLGEALEDFGENMKAFIECISGVNPDSIEAAKNVASMLLVLTAADVLDSLTSWITGGVNYEEMGENLKAFGEAVVDFSNTISGKIDVAAVEAATNAGALLVELNKSLPRSGGWIQDIIGEKDFDAFATACKSFAECILGINEVVSQEGFELQSEKIEQLVAAGTQFSELNNALPRSGGIAQDLAGEQDLAKFGAACVAFAGCMIMISQLVSSDQFVVQSDKISQLVTAGTQFSELNNALPRSGGIAQDLAGEQDLAKFGVAVAAFAGCMILVNQAISQEGFSVNLDGIEQLKQAGLKMNELQEALPKSGGWWQEIAGSQDIGDFGESIATFAEAIVGFSTSGAALNTDGINLALTTAERLKTFMTSLIDLDYSGVDAFTGIGSGGIGADGPAYDIACAIAKFSDKVDDINTEAVTVAVTAAQKLKSLIASLVGLDTSGIENFKPQDIGTQMKGYADKVAGIDTETVSSSISSANRLKSFMAGLSDLDTSGITNFKPGSIGSALKAYGDSVSGTNLGAISSSIAAAIRLKSFISSLSGLNTSGVGSFKIAVDQLSTVNIAGLVKAFSAASVKLQNAGADMINGLVKGMQSKSPAVTAASTKITTSANKVITSKASAFATAGGNLAAKIASGISSKKGAVNSAVSSCLSSAVTKIRDKYTSFYNAGSYLVDGFKNGISDNAYKATAKAKAMAEAAVKAAREVLKINSPSKVFREIGSGVPEGFAQGIGMLGGKVKRSAGDMASTAIKSTRSAMSSILDALNSDMDAQPTIRPVVDLSDVKTGAAAVTGMFDGIQTVGVRSNLNAINATMNAKLQNGANDDVISAINKLGNGLENNRGDTYNFGDFTYDDGSNVSDAIRTLIRYAKIGRRV